MQIAPYSLASGRAFATLGLAGLAFCCSADAFAQNTVGHHGAWSVYCAESCWVATAARSDANLFLVTALRDDERIETSVMSTVSALSPQDDLILRSHSVETRLTVAGQSAFLSREDYEAKVVGTFIKGASATVSINGRPNEFSLNGYTAALADAHERSGRDFRAASYTDDDGGLVIVLDEDEEDVVVEDAPEELEPDPTPLPEPTVEPVVVNPPSPPEPVDGAGCTDADREAEAQRYIASYGQQPSVPSASWKWSYDMTRGLRKIVERQGERCQIDVTNAVRYYDEIIDGLERVGRSAGWL